MRIAQGVFVSFTDRIDRRGTDSSPVASAAEGFKVFEPIVETNASAGDVGFHYLLDGGAWKMAQLFDADGDRILDLKGTVAEFIERFEAGRYLVRGRNLAGEPISIRGVLTHNLPAAPRTNIVVDADHTVTINWSRGTDLGNCAVPPGIPDPATVRVVRWEVAVEPNAGARLAGRCRRACPSLS